MMIEFLQLLLDIMRQIAEAEPESKPSTSRSISKSSPLVYTSEVVTKVDTHSFMSIERLSNGQVIVGTYSAHAKKSLVYCVGHPGPVDEIAIGRNEAVFRVSEAEGKVLLSCEHRELWWDYLRSDPKDYNFKFLKKLKEGKHKGAYDARKVLGKLVYLGGGEINVSGLGTVKEWNDRYYVKFIFQAGSTAYIGGVDLDRQRAGWFKSTNGVSWDWEEIGPEHSRFMHVHVPADGKKLWLVGTNNFREWHNKDSATLWTYDFASKQLEPLYTFEGFHYSSCIAKGSNDEIYLGLTKEWKGNQPGATLVEWTGRPEVVDEFEETELRGIVCGENKIWAATRTNLDVGKVYLISKQRQ